MPDVYTLLAEARAEMDVPKKNATAKGHSFEYSYATLDEMFRVILPPLQKRNIGLRQYVDGPSRLVHGTTPEADSALAHQCEMCTCVDYQGETYVLDRHPFVFASDAQDQGARETYARRYSLQTVFALAAEDDTDGASRDELKEKYQQAKKSGVDEAEIKERLEAAIPNKSTKEYTAEEATLAVSIIDGMIGG